MNIIEIAIVGFVAAYPLLVNPLSSPVFGLPKLTFLKLFSLAIAVLYLSRSIRAGRFKLTASDMRFPLTAFFVLAFISGPQSISPLISLAGQYGRWEGLSTLTCYVILYLAAHNAAANKKLLKPLFSAVLISSLLVSTVAIIEHFWVNPFLSFARIYCAAGFGRPNAFESGRSMATFGNAMFLGAYYTIIIPIIVSHLLSRTRGLRDRSITPKTPSYIAISYLALFLSAIALLLTFGRSAWLGTIAGVILVGFLNRDSIKKSRSRLITVAVILIVALTIVGTTGTTYTLLNRAASTFKIEGSSLTRIQIWDASVHLVADDPLLGSGPDTFKYVFGKHKPQGWAQHSDNPLLDKAHNEALQTAVTGGAISLLAYLWIFTLFILSGAKRLRSLETLGSETLHEDWLAAGIIGATLAYWIQLQFSFSHLSVAPLFWIFLGVGSRLFLTHGELRTIKTGLDGSKKSLAIVFIIVTASYLTVLSVVPLVADIHFARARDLEGLGKLPEAVDEYSAASSLNKAEPLYKTSLGEALFELGRKTRDDTYLSLGTAAFEQAQRINPVDEQVYFTAAASYLMAGRAGRPVYLEKAIENDRRGLVLNPVMVDAYIDMGVAYAYLKDYDNAIGAWNRALAIEPGSDRAYFNMGWVYERKGNHAHAKNAYEKALRLNPKLYKAKAAYDRL